MTGKSTTQEFLSGVFIVLLVVAVYLPALQGGFIWDDDAHVTANPCIVGPLGFKEIWTSGEAGYFPLVLTSFWVQHALWGLNPLPYHLFNIAMHAACAVLLWRVLLSLKVPGAWLGAVLWALHPVQVESVAWMTELKNTQSALFYLLAILFFVRWRAASTSSDNEGRNANYVLVVVCVVLAVLSKSSTVMLPVVLGLCAWWLDGRWRWRTVVSLAPLFLISAVAAGWTIWEQQFHSGALGEEWAYGWVARAVIAGNVVWFYFGKLLWPHPLIFIYRRWDPDTFGAASFLPGLAAVAALFVLWWYRNGRTRPVFFAYACYLVSLFPVMGFFNVYFFRYSFVGDHLQYLASMAPLALAGAAIARVSQVLESRIPRLALAIPGALVAAFSVLTWQHAGVFRNDETLWRDTLTKNPGCWLAHNNLGTVLLSRGDLSDAIARFEVTLQLHPDYPEGHANLANALSESGRIDEAVEHYQRALQLDPQHPGVHNALGVALMTKGMTDEAIEHFRAALRARPGEAAMAHGNLGSALAMRGKLEEAMGHFDEALRLNPGHLNTRMNYGSALATQQRYAEAVEQYTEVLRRAWGHAPAHKNMGVALAKLGRTNEAIFHLQEALRLDLGISQVRQQLEELGATTRE